MRLWTWTKDHAIAATLIVLMLVFAVALRDWIVPELRIAAWMLPLVITPAIMKLFRLGNSFRHEVAWIDLLVVTIFICIASIILGNPRIVGSYTIPLFLGLGLLFGVWGGIRRLGAKKRRPPAGRHGG